MDRRSAPAPGKPGRSVIRCSWLRTTAPPSVAAGLILWGRAAPTLPAAHATTRQQHASSAHDEAGRARILSPPEAPPPPGDEGRRFRTTRCGPIGDCVRWALGMMGARGASISSEMTGGQVQTLLFGGSSQPFNSCAQPSHVAQSTRRATSAARSEKGAQARAREGERRPLPWACKPERCGTPRRTHHRSPSSVGLGSSAARGQGRSGSPQTRNSSARQDAADPVALGTVATSGPWAPCPPIPSAPEGHPARCCSLISCVRGPSSRLASWGCFVSHRQAFIVVGPRLQHRAAWGVGSCPVPGAAAAQQQPQPGACCWAAVPGAAKRGEPIAPAAQPASPSPPLLPPPQRQQHS